MHQDGSSDLTSQLHAYIMAAQELLGHDDVETTMILLISGTCRRDQSGGRSEAWEEDDYAEPHKLP
jgi:hypothetical protein